ncbi:MAG: hypothetical protein M1536_05025 [Firmicutes bacterium]|nr:hypothetical protein [Bacillota bacterium]
MDTVINSGKIIPEITEIDTKMSPADIFSSLSNKTYPFLLESGMDRGKLGRFSFLGFAPFMVFTAKKDNIKIQDFKLSREVNYRGNPFWRIFQRIYNLLSLEDFYEHSFRNKRIKL